MRQTHREIFLLLVYSSNDWTRAKTRGQGLHAGAQALGHLRCCPNRTSRELVRKPIRHVGVTALPLHHIPALKSMVKKPATWHCWAWSKGAEIVWRFPDHLDSTETNIPVGLEYILTPQLCACRITRILAWDPLSIVEFLLWWLCGKRGVASQQGLGWVHPMDRTPHTIRWDLVIIQWDPPSPSAQSCSSSLALMWSPEHSSCAPVCSGGPDLWFTAIYSECQPMLKGRDPLWRKTQVNFCAVFWKW